MFEFLEVRSFCIFLQFKAKRNFGTLFRSRIEVELVRAGLFRIKLRVSIARCLTSPNLLWFLINLPKTNLRRGSRQISVPRSTRSFSLAGIAGLKADEYNRIHCLMKSQDLESYGRRRVSQSSRSLCR